MSEPIRILEKNLMILASAGSGKTFQLGNRVIGLVGARGHAPNRIMALTFTRKAAGEFADSVLTKLAEAATDPVKAAMMVAQIGEPLDVHETLKKIVQALPRFQLGTMDSFFSRVVRGFQYELGLSGSFELIEGPQLQAATEEILHHLLRDALDDDGATDFLHAFKRATMGKEEQGVGRRLEGFLALWHGIWKSGDFTGGVDGVFGALPGPDVWEEQKYRLASALRRAMEGTTWTDARQEKAVAALIDTFELHTIGSGTMDQAPSMLAGLRETIADGREVVALKHYKEFAVNPMAGQLFREAILLLSQCELAAAVARTRAVAELVGRFDVECERRLRRKGLLGFDDVKVLMGRWSKSEEDRVRRAIIDFRLDARIDHWLLDEYQDTSVAEWEGLKPLIEELAGRDNSSLFVVGDKKQAIYGWRGGDVRLFDNMAHCYAEQGKEVQVRRMPESWRSADSVLALVNRTCGDTETIGHLFGDAMVQRWEWEPHVSAKPALTGESRVEVVEGKDEEAKEERLIQLLEEIGIGKREMTCGILVRTNDQVRHYAGLLRTHGFDVIEEGRRQPTTDNPVGVALSHLVKWLADPADRFAEEVVKMSPLQRGLQEKFGNAWQAIWEKLLLQAQREGFAATVEAVIEPLWADLSEFGRRRAGDAIAALAELDAKGGATAREAARWIAELEVPQSPGFAAVQVMTVHKSKGLGFDVVVLPEVEDRQVPNVGRFQVAQGEFNDRRWFLQPPAEWVRSLVPQLRDAQERWSDDQRYEAMCVMYVALTRAKRGLYVLLSESTVTRKGAEDFASPANWLVQSLALDDGNRVFQQGEARWFDDVPVRSQAGKEKESLSLLPAVPMRGRLSPSHAKRTVTSLSGVHFGKEVHQAWQNVEWIDEQAPAWAATASAKLVSRMLLKPEIRERFERKGRLGILLREQAVEAIHEGKWVSGVVDRLHVWRDAEGSVTFLELIDFKTDGLEEGELIERYRGQMELYRVLLAKAYGVPASVIRCSLLSSSLEKMIEISA